MPSESVSPNVPQAQSAEIPPWLLVVLLVFFPPAALYFMWKVRRYHSWFGVMLMLYGVMMLVVSGIQILVVMPRMMALYADFNVKVPAYGFVVNYGGLVYGILQILLGMYVWRTVKKVGELSKRQLFLASAILVLNLLAVGLVPATAVLSVVLPLYNLTSAL